MKWDWLPGWRTPFRSWQTGQIVESGDLEQVLTDPQHMENKKSVGVGKSDRTEACGGAPS
jgi:hypothetical protein